MHYLFFKVNILTKHNWENSKSVRGLNILKFEIFAKSKFYVYFHQTKLKNFELFFLLFLVFFSFLPLNELFKMSKNRVDFVKLHRSKSTR